MDMMMVKEPLSKSSSSTTAATAAAAASTTTDAAVAAVVPPPNKNKQNNNMPTTSTTQQSHQQHYIYIGLQASSGAYCTEAHKAFQKAVKIWQCREGRSKETRQELKKKGKLWQVVNELLAHVATKTDHFPQLFYRPNTKTCVKIDMDNNKEDDDSNNNNSKTGPHDKVLREYLLGNRGSFLRVSLSKAKEQLDDFQQDLLTDEFVCLVKTLEQFQLDIETDPLSTPKNLLKVKENGYLTMLNAMLAEALKNKPTLGGGSSTGNKEKVDDRPSGEDRTKTTVVGSSKTVLPPRPSSTVTESSQDNTTTTTAATASAPATVDSKTKQKKRKDRDNIGDEDKVENHDRIEAKVARRTRSSGNNNNDQKKQMEIASVMLGLGGQNGTTPPQQDATHAEEV